MVFGAYYLTLAVEGAKGSGRAFRHSYEVQAAFDVGDIDLHASITLRPLPGSSLARRLEAAGTVAEGEASVTLETTRAASSSTRRSPRGSAT